jgi:hypothetical protein
MYLMRKSLMSRIIGLAAIYCLVFCLLVIIQFSNMRNFSVSTGAMTIRGRYLQTQQQTKQEDEEITGGVKILYGGLEFSLKEENGKGLTLTNINNINIPVNPQMMLNADNSVCFTLPGGTTLTFTPIDSANGQELRINAEFTEDILEVTIPIVLRRSSLVRDSGQLGVMYGGSRYVFTSLGQELENGYLTLSKNNTFISYRARGKLRAFDPSDYIITQAPNYDTVIRNWQNTVFTQWNQNPVSLQYEDDIIAYSAQALLRGNYTQATGAISRDFINSSRQSFRSSGFVGGMTGAYNSFASFENEKINLITRLIREGSLNILKEDHILDFLFTRSNPVLANEVIEIINDANPDMLTSDHCPGLLEIFYDMRQWRPEVKNPIEHLTNQMILLISDNLYRDTENDTIYASSSESNNSEYGMRLGKALVFWADATQNTEWSAIGRSLVLSAITNGNAGRLHNILNPTEYYPRASWLTNEGLWAWTVSPSIRATYIDSNLNIAVSFPANMSHYMLIRGVRPFIGIQIHGMDWRSDSQFERYDSSGWIYYPADQTLVLKLRHRVIAENVRIIYRVAAPAPVIDENSETENNTGAVVD